MSLRVTAGLENCSSAGSCLSLTETAAHQASGSRSSTATPTSPTFGGLGGLPEPALLVPALAILQALGEGAVGGGGGVKGMAGNACGHGGARGGGSNECSGGLIPERIMAGSSRNVLTDRRRACRGSDPPTKPSPGLARRTHQSTSNFWIPSDSAASPIGPHHVSKSRSCPIHQSQSPAQLGSMCPESR